MHSCTEREYIRLSHIVQLMVGVVSAKCLVSHMYLIYANFSTFFYKCTVEHSEVNTHLYRPPASASASQTDPRKYHPALVHQPQLQHRHSAMCSTMSPQLDSCLATQSSLSSIHCCCRRLCRPKAVRSCRPFGPSSVWRPFGCSAAAHCDCPQRRCRPA